MTRSSGESIPFDEHETHDEILENHHEVHSDEIPANKSSETSEEHKLSGNPSIDLFRVPPSIFQRLKSLQAMIILLLLGILTALAQHFFFSYVSGRQPQEFIIPQDWVIRIGTALAFLFKTSLVAIVGIVFCQRSWFSFQQQAISVGGIDAIFGILRDPLKFFVKDLLKVKVVLLLALISWLLPLSAIFSTASLTGTVHNF